MEKRYENLEECMLKELEKLNKKLATTENPEMSIQELDKIDKIYHALKSAETYFAMKDSAEAGMNGRSYNSYGYDAPMSYARGRDSMGRYTSRGDGFSGHYPMYPMPYDMRY